MASAIAAVAAIEIPQKQWTDLITNLCNNAAHDQIEIRHAALETLGFICEELVPEDLTSEEQSLVV